MKSSTFEPGLRAYNLTFSCRVIGEPIVTAARRDISIYRPTATKSSVRVYNFFWVSFKARLNTFHASFYRSLKAGDDERGLGPESAGSGGPLYPGCRLPAFAGDRPTDRQLETGYLFIKKK